MSSRPSTWPALTASPSRTVSCLTSAATLAFTKALLTAFSPPEMSSVRGRSSRRATTTSVGASSSAGRRLRRRRARLLGPARLDRAADEQADDREREHRQQPFQPAFHRVRLGFGRGCSVAAWPRRCAAAAVSLQPVQHQVDLRLDHRLRVERAADRAGAERVLVHDQEDQRRDQRVDDVGRVDRPELAAVDAALQQPASIACAGLDDLVDVELGDVREVARLRHHQLEDAATARVSPIRSHQRRSRAQQVGRGALEAGGSVDALDDQVDDVLAHHRLEQFFLARVVEVQRALGDAGARGHFFGAGGGEALLDEQVERRIEQFLRTGFLAALATGAGGAEAAVRGGQGRA